MTDRELPPDTVLGSYGIVRVVGVGGMGSVYEPVHSKLGRRVALKTLAPSLATNHEARERFPREAKILTQVRHPNVVNVTDFGSTHKTAFLVMEFLAGETLADLLARDRRFEVSRMLDLLLPIMDALAHGHDRGVVHRDIKPQNIFLAHEPLAPEVPKLLDFGISKSAPAPGAFTLTGSGAMLGTPQYMAPEQIEGAKTVDPRADQYAIGLVMFECLLGRPARQGTSPFEILERVSRGETPSLRAAWPTIDLRLEAAVSRALEWRHTDRYPSRREFMRALIPFARSEVRWVWAERLVSQALHR
jgi:serine/threonine protein kinase